MLAERDLFEFARDKIALVSFFSIFYIVVYFASKEIGLANAIKTSGAIIYLPAGVRLLACLIGRFWGGLGIFVATCFVVAPNVFPNESCGFHFAIAFINTSSVLISVLITLKLFKISEDLSNLRFIHLPFIDLIATFSQAFCYYLFLYFVEHIEEAELLPKFISQMTGNFLGGMVFMLTLLLLLNLRMKNTSK
jgi:hypothetical protein